MEGAQYRHQDTRKRTDEALEIISRLWREESVDFTGTHYRLTNASIAPRPVQPDLPMWIGGGSEAAIKRTARYGTGWQGGGEAPEEAGRIVAAIRQAAEAAGRPIDEDHYGAGVPFYLGKKSDRGVAEVMAAYNKRTGRDPERIFAIGRRADRPRPHRRVCRGRYLEVHPAAGRRRWRGACWPRPTGWSRSCWPLVATRWPKH